MKPENIPAPERHSALPRRAILPGIATADSHENHFFFLLAEMMLR
jgi:hypothetical protein